tara:strand:+ start:1057 stop:1179 length:123 start_codon:yes stop_codon:yes gene_type:complete
MISRFTIVSFTEFFISSKEDLRAYPLLSGCLFHYKFGGKQ